MKIGILIGLIAFTSIFWTGYADAVSPLVTEAVLKKGKALYTTNCISCHGERGDGAGPAGAYMNPKPRHFVKDKFVKGDSPEMVLAAITDGLEGTAMTGYGYLPEEDRLALVHYVLKFREKKGK